MHKSLFELRQGQSISYQANTDENINEYNWDNITIEGCNISKCLVKNTSMFCSDIIGSTFINCEFVDDNLSHSDICSIIVSNTRFIKIDFSTSAMRDCEFIDCEFLNCSFEHIAMTHTKFTNCNFISIELHQSSSYLNEFYNCCFSNCTLNGNFYYSIFSNYRSKNNSICPKLLAFNYFINNEAIHDNDTENVIQYLKDNYMFLNIEIFRLNRQHISLDQFIIEVLYAISQLIKNNIVIRLEQIEFIIKLFDYSCKYNKLPLLTIHQGISIIDNIFESVSFNNETYAKSNNYLNQLKNSMFLEYISRANNLPQIKTIDFSSENTVLCKITYNEKPNVQLSDIVNDICKRLNNSNWVSKRVKTEQGSFIEFVEILSEAEPIINIILTLTTGIIIPVILSNKKESLTRKESTHNNSDQKTSFINSNINSPTTIINNNFNFSLTEIDTKTQQVADIAFQVLNKYNINPSNNYNGYSKGNFRTIEIIDDQDMK